MQPAGDIPSFPSSAFVEKVLDLGFGSGAWTRGDFEECWGKSAANKFVADGKRCGWLLSPYQNTFFIPAARDLAIMGWLPDVARAELGIGRALAASGLRSWCFSAWLSSVELGIGVPLFVSDLRDGAGTRARRVPFPDNMVVVSDMPPPGLPDVWRSALVSRGAGRVSSAPGLLGRRPRATLPSRLEELDSSAPGVTADPRSLSFIASPGVRDPAWVLALLISLGLPRIEERLSGITEMLVQADGGRSSGKPATKASRAAFKQRAARYAGAFGAPAPVTAWDERKRDASLLLLPPALWREVDSTAFSRRFSEVERLVR
ncbi:MAG: hypothetical protein LC624_08310 [Halobacteriales archaeon]|nr:hypothetical protein [Halobacteriales archaeon]